MPGGKKTPSPKKTKKTTPPRTGKRGRIEVEEGSDESTMIDAVTLASILESVQARIDESLSKQTCDFLLKIEEKNSQLLSNLNFVKEELQEAISSNSKKIEDLTEQVEFYKKRADENTKWIEDLKNDRLTTRLELNSKEQRIRGPSIRIHQYNTPSVGMKVLHDVYREFIKPSFILAVKAQELDRVPSLVECIEFGHKLRKFPNMTGPPSIIVRFRSRIFKNVFMAFKKEPIALFNARMNHSTTPRGTPPSSPRGSPPASPRHAEVDDVMEEEQNISYATAAAKTPPSGVTVRIGDDLTAFNRQLMSWLYSLPPISGARLSGDGIQFSLKSDPKSWLTVSNPFAKTISELQNDLGPAVPPIVRQAAQPPPRRPAYRNSVSTSNPLN